MKEQHFYPIWLVVLGALLYLPGLGSRDFWAPVEPRYAEIARVMFLKSEWIVPTVNGALYTDKPILYFWLVLIFSHIAGSVNEWTVRLPAALGGLGAVLATYKLGKDFFGARVGFIAAVVLATSVRVIWESRWAHLDMLFSFFFTFAMLFAARVILQKRNGKELYWFYALLALATLTKGLIGVVLPGLILAAYLVITREWRLIREARLPQGMAIFLVLGAPWFVMVNQATEGTWLRDFIYLHHVQRYTAGFGHREPFYYYLRTLPVDLLPWTIFALPALLIYRPRRDLLTEPVRLFFTLWFLMVFLFFTFSDTKRDLYLLPLMPVAGLFIAGYIDDLVSGRLAETRVQRVLNLVFFGSFLIGCLALPAATWVLRNDAFWISLPAGAALGAPALAAVWYGWRRLTWPLFWSVATIMMTGVITASVWVLPYIDRYKSPRPFSVAVNRALPPGAPLYIYADTMDDFNYYMGREVIPILSGRKAARELLTQGAGFLLIERNDFERLRTSFSADILLQQPVGSDIWYLIARAPVPPSTSTAEP